MESDSPNNLQLKFFYKDEVFRGEFIFLTAPRGETLAHACNRKSSVNTQTHLAISQASIEYLFQITRLK